MRFTCSQKELSKALNTVSKAVTTRTTIPILKGILLKAHGDKLTMIASDLDLSIEKEINAHVEDEGDVVVLSKLFGEIIRKLPSGDITITTDGENSVKITGNSSEFNIVSFPADEFPSIGEIEDNKMITLNREMFKSMINKTSFAASLDEAKGVITGVLIEIKEDHLNLVALDGFRMAVAKEKMISSQEEKIIITSKILNDISKIISDVDDEDMGIILEKKRAVIILEGTRVILRLMEGEFINYRSIIPAESDTNVVLDRGDFLESIERASLFAKEGKNNLVKLSIEGNNMTITSKSEEGNVKEEVMISCEGPSLEIGFNSKYLIDVLRAIDDESIRLEFKSGVKPCLAKPIEGDDYLYLILPVRLTGN